MPFEITNHKRRYLQSRRTLEAAKEWAKERWPKAEFDHLHATNGVQVYLPGKWHPVGYIIETNNT